MAYVYLIKMAFCLISLSYARVGSDMATASTKNYSTVTIEKDGSYTIVQTQNTMILSDEGRRQMAIQKIVFDDQTFDVRVTAASILFGNDEHKIPLSEVRRTTINADDYQSMGMKTLSQLEVPFDNLKTGSTVSLTLVKKSKKAAEFAGGYSDDIIFGMIGEADRKVEFDSAVPLHFSINDPGKLLTISEQKGGARYKLSVALKGSIAAPDWRRVRSLEQVQRQFPRIQVSVVTDWKEFAAQQASYYDLKETKIPENLKEVAKSLTNRKTDREKVAGILLWMAENFTYSGRWVAPGSDWHPRALSKIASEKVGDCKDTALIALALLNEVGVKAEPVLVRVLTSPSDIFSFPVDIKNPLPANTYFNHVVVRYRDGESWRLIDPGVPVADASRTPYFLDYGWALNLRDPQPSLYQIVGDPKDYASATMKTEIVQRPSGGFLVHTSADFTGELSNILKAKYFRDGEKGFQAMLEGLTPVEPLSFKARASTKITREGSPLHVEFEYGMADDSGKNQLIYMPHLIPTFQWHERFGAQAYPRMPMKISETIHVSNAFVEKEPSFDVHNYGPFADVDRTVKNVDGAVVIQDDIQIRSAAPLRFESEVEPLDYHLQRINGGGRDAIPLLAPSADRKSFEAMVDTTKPYELPKSQDNRLESSLQELRRLEVYLQKNPRDERLLRIKAQAIRSLGFMNSSVFLKEHILRSSEIALQAVSADPKVPANYAEVGQNYVYLNDFENAKKYFLQGFALSKKSWHVLQLGGMLARRMEKYDQSASYYAAAASYAETDYQKATSLEDQAWILCWNLKRCPEAARVYEQILAIKPESAWRMHNAALIYKEMGDNRRAIELEKKGQSMMSFSAGALNLYRAEADELMKRFEKDREDPVKLEALNHEAGDLYKKPSSNGTALLILVRINSQLARLKKDRALFVLATQYLDEMNKSGVYAPGESWGVVMRELMRTRNLLQGDTSIEVPVENDVEKLAGNYSSVVKDPAQLSAYKKAVEDIYTSRPKSYQVLRLLVQIYSSEAKAEGNRASLQKAERYAEEMKKLDTTPLNEKQNAALMLRAARQACELARASASATTPTPVVSQTQQSKDPH